VASPNLLRLLAPATVAVVGASEKLAMSNNAVLPMLEAGIDVLLVNPNRETVYDRPAAPTLTELGTPVDAVLALVNAERSVAVVEEAAALGCGGVVVAAAGFTEIGTEGAALQERLRAAATTGDLAVVGPNCSGFLNVPRRITLFTGGRIPLEAGGVAVVSQSGFLVRSALAAGRERRLGFSIAVSSGNEAICDLADYLEALVADRDTRVICLVIEKVRDPERFFAAVAAARAAGKAVLALKLGRTERSRDILRSHTGAVADESWVYDLVLGQLGVQTARDVDELLDMAQLLAQLPPEQWRPVRGVAVVASSGGVAGVAADAADAAGVVLPPVDELTEWVTATIPGEGSRNPLDMTGFVMRDPALLEELFVRYGTAPSIDALVLCWWAAEGDEAWSRLLLEPLRMAAARASVPIIVSPVEATALGAWTAEFSNLAFCRGLTSTYRALQALGGAAAAPARTVNVPPVDAGARRPDLVDSMLPFSVAMELLTDAGLTVAPFTILDEGAEDDPHLRRLGEELVVKLADVAHRTEIGAVRVGVAPDEVAATVRDLRAIAAEHGFPGTVAVQQQVRGHGEAFLGIQAATDLGAIALLGRGGVLVEVAGGTAGRLLPFGDGDAVALVDQVAGPVAWARLRGQAPWAPGPLVDAVEALERVWEQTRHWLVSADINPLVVTEDGVVAVDALLLG
jgi:acyl-CoA synthetase (NDP forming)